MKALKEKRIRLRSLWGRSLVILSLLALVFAACGDSDSGSNTGSNLDPLISVTYTGTLTNHSYMGIKPDLTGLVITSTFASGRQHVHSGLTPASYVTDPPVVCGYYNYGSNLGPGGVSTPGATKTDWLPETTYRVFLNCGECGHDINVTLPFDRVYGIVRDNLVIGRDDWLLGTKDQHITFSTASGLQITDHGMRQEYYVDENPDFKGLVAQALYEDGTWQTIPLDKHVNTKHPNQAILRPLYNNPTDPAKSSGGGWLYVTVGRHPKYDASVAPNLQTEVADYILNTSNNWIHNPNLTAPAGGYTWAGHLVDSGLTVVMPLKTIHHVTSFNWANAAPVLGDFFYWQEDDVGSWLARTGPDFEFRVSYTDGKSFVYTTKQLWEMTEVWYNENLGSGPPRLQPIGGVVDTREGLPFWISSVIENEAWRSRSLSANVHYFNDRTPQITYYYRGYQLPVDVPVLTRFMNITLVPDAVAVDMTKAQDNDNINENTQPNDWTFARDKIAVNVQYSAYSNAAVTGTVTAYYAWRLTRPTWNDTTPGQLADVPTGSTSTDWYAPAPPNSYYNGSPTDWVRIEDRKHAWWLKNTTDPKYTKVGDFYYFYQEKYAGEWYTMNFGRNRDSYLDHANRDATLSYPDLNPALTTPAGPGTLLDQYNWGVCDNPANSGKIRPVSIYYTVPQYPIEPINLSATYVYVPGDIYTGAQRTARVSVDWTGIR